MLAFLGGTGPEGKGLALRLALAGEEIIIGSRDETRARDAAESLLELAPGRAISGDVNEVAAQRADVVFLTMPFEGQKPTLEQLASHLAGKTVVDVIAPMEFVRGQARALSVDEGSAAMQAQHMLPDSRVVGAFQNVSAVDLIIPEKIMEGDVVVCSGHPEAKEQVMAMVLKIKDLRPVDGGALENTKYVEDLTPLLVNINRIYKAHSTIKIVGI